MACVLNLLLTGLLATVVKHLYSLYHNYTTAKELGLPIVICPVDKYSILWLLNQVWLLKLFCRLPDSCNAFTKYLVFGWQYDDRHSEHLSVHDRLGPAIVLATPGKNQIIISDPTAVHDMLTRYRVFTKPWLYQIHDLFGLNVDTVNGEDWVTHRKLTAPASNEKVSRTVWEEASRQAQAMLDICCESAGLAEKTPGETERQPHKSLYQDTKTIALHVLMCAGVGARQDFKDGATKPARGHRMSFVKALNVVFETLPLPWACHFAPGFLQRSFFPQAVRDAA